MNNNKTDKEYLSVLLCKERRRFYMRYVFFDIECADGGKGSICSFGYVICDEEFREIESDDIIINPDSRFYLVGRSKRPDLFLAYPEAVFRKAPLFPHYYERIRSILEADDQIVIGHSVQDDAAFLCKSCARYGLPPLKFKFADSQSLYADYLGKKGQVALDKACDAFGIPKDHKIHKSEDDARATMRLVCAICKAKGKTLPDAIRACECVGETADLKIFCSYMHPNRTMFIHFLSTLQPKRKCPDILRGKCVSAATAVEQPNQKYIYHLVQMIADAGGTYTRVPSQCDIFITSGDPEKAKVCKRTRVAKQAKHGGARIEMLSLNEFLKKLGVSSAVFDKLPPVDITWM